MTGNIIERKPEYKEKTTVLPQVTNTFKNITGISWRLHCWKEPEYKGENIYRPQVTNTFKNITGISWRLYCWKEPEYKGKNIYRPQVTSTFNNIQVVLWQPALWSYIGGGMGNTRRKPETHSTSLQLYCDRQLYRRRNPEYMKVTSDTMSCSTTLQLYRDSFIGGVNQSIRRKPPTCRSPRTLSTTLQLYRDSFICSTCRKYFSVLSSFMTYHRICNTTGATGGASTAHPSVASEFFIWPPVFWWGSCCSVLNFLCSVL